MGVELGQDGVVTAAVRVEDVAGGFSITTSSFRARVDAASGIVVSLVDAVTGALLVGRGEVTSPESLRQHRHDLGLGALVVTHELPHAMSSWVTDRADSEHTLISGGTTRLVESGPIRAVLETRHRFGLSRATVRCMFYQSLPWIEFEVQVQWEEPGGELVGVPGLAISFGNRSPAAELWTETPFGAARSAADGYLRPMLRWADLGSASGGLAVANDSKYGVEAMGPRMRVPLVRSAYDPDPTSDVGHTITSRFRVMPHTGGWQDADVVGLGAGLNHPVRFTAGAGGAPVQTLRPTLVPGSGVVIAGMQPAATGMLVRLSETTGRDCVATLAGLGQQPVRVCDLFGEPGDLLPQHNGQVAMPFAAFEVRTVLVQTRP